MRPIPARRDASLEPAGSAPEVFDAFIRAEIEQANLFK